MAAGPQLPPATELPPPQAPVNVPLADPTWTDKVQITGHRDRISLKVREAPLGAVLALLAEQHGLNLVTAEPVNQAVSLTLTNVSLEQALDALALTSGYTWAQQNNVIVISSLGKERSSPILQGQVVRVFCLNYVLANDVDKVVKGLISPVGLSFINQTSPTDQRKTYEQVVVQDLPAYVERVANYIQQIDQPPRQVLVEAHVLQVSLKGDYAHGVNFEAMFNIAGAPITLGTMGFVDPASSPASFIRIDGNDLDVLIKCIETTAETKTLATPKVAVLNGQESRIQIGSKLGYKTLENTQTATLENVQFLDTGVILKVTPNITEDGQILLQVNPQVSDGLIDPETGLPNSNTTEVETKVLLADGEALIIGGLIKDVDQENVSKIPYLGDIKHLGYFFQKRSVSRQRTEIIIALLPRLISCAPGTRQRDCVEVDRALTPLLQCDLNQVDRKPWEPGVPRFWPDHSQPFAYGHAEPAPPIAPWPNSGPRVAPEQIPAGTLPIRLPAVTRP